MAEYSYFRVALTVGDLNTAQLVLAPPPSTNSPTNTTPAAAASLSDVANFWGLSQGAGRRRT